LGHRRLDRGVDVPLSQVTPMVNERRSGLRKSLSRELNGDILVFISSPRPAWV
jgi:hypothetical protein